MPTFDESLLLGDQVLKYCYGVCRLDEVKEDRPQRTGSLSGVLAGGLAVQVLRSSSPSSVMVYTVRFRRLPRVSLWPVIKPAASMRLSSRVDVAMGSGPHPGRRLVEESGQVVARHGRASRTYPSSA